jgi:hypothetical protein
MRMTLPLTFPNDPPNIRSHKVIFHPNVSVEGVQLSAAWQPDYTLLDFLKTVGELLAFRAYDPEAVVNSEALEWMAANAESMPLDSTADFSPDAGGTPMERIEREGRTTLAEVRKELEDARHAMLDPEAAPGPTEVRDFCRQMSQTLSLFFPADIPHALRHEAIALETWVRELPSSLAVWEFLREQRAAIQTIRSTNGDLSERHEPLLRHVSALDALAPASEPTDLASAFAVLPPQKATETLRLRLPTLVRETSDLTTTLLNALETLDQVSAAVPVLGDSELGRQLQAEVDAAAGDSQAARASAVQMLASIESVLERAKGDASAIEQLCLWREYRDLLVTASALEKKLAHLGAAGIQAYYMVIEGEEFGPFQFDEPVDLGSARVAVRSPERNRIGLVDVQTGDVIGKSDTGSLAAKLGGSAEGGQLTTIRLTERWDELALQVEFLIGQVANFMKLLGEPTLSLSWVGNVLAMLNLPESLAAVREEHRVLSDRWGELLLDLQALEPVKARIETWNLIQRIKETVPSLLHQVSGQQRALDQSTADLRPILAHCTRDTATDQLVIPAKLVQSYSEAVRRRDRATRTIDRLEALLSQLRDQVKHQLANQRFVGPEGLPEFRRLSPFPPDLEEMVRGMTDAALGDDVADLEVLLKMPLQRELHHPPTIPQTVATASVTAPLPIPCVAPPSLP